jgi:hypothetical protein
MSQWRIGQRCAICCASSHDHLDELAPFASSPVLAGTDELTVADIAVCHFARADSVRYAEHREFLGDQHDMKNDRVASRLCGIEQLEFRGCEKTVSAMNDSPHSMSLARVGAASRVVGVPGRVSRASRTMRKL